MTKQWNYNIFVQMLYRYFIYNGKIFFGCAVFVACCNIIRALWETKKEERLSCTKKYKEEFLWGTSLFWMHTLPTMSFLIAFLVYSCWMTLMKMHNISMGGILCDIENMKNFLQFNNSWLASLRTWSYFRLFLASVILARTLN